MTDTFTAAVIPAKVGIQTTDNIPTHNQRLGWRFFGSLVEWLVVHQWDNTPNTLCPLREDL
jgi:hypothetical protein